MSRVGQASIPLSPQAKVEVQGTTVVVEGPKGKLTHQVPPELSVEKTEGQLRVKRSNDEKRVKSLHGLHRTLIANMVRGVIEGFSKELELSGVGYKAQVTGPRLEMYVGFTHAVVFTAPAGITIEVPKATQVVIKGVDKQLVGQVAARIRAFRPPEPYKGKGIKYVGEVIRRKAGKAVA